MCVSSFDERCCSQMGIGGSRSWENKLVNQIAMNGWRRNHFLPEEKQHFGVRILLPEERQI